MIILFEKYNGRPTKSDIITSKDTSSMYIVLYVDSTYLLYSKRYKNGTLSLTKDHLHNLIDGELANVETVEEAFKREPEAIIESYLDMSDFKQDKIVEEKSDIYRIDDILYMWRLKIPNLEMYIKANKYNL